MTSPRKRRSNSRRSAARRVPLDRRTIAREALRIIDAAGLEQLSMRRLGAELGVEGMSIYHHFASKAELLDGVLELLLEEMAPPADDYGPPLTRLRRTFEATRMVAIRHPHAFVLLPTRRFNTDQALEYYEHLLRLFRDAGLDAGQSARFFRLLAGFVTGAGLAEIGSRAQQPDATPIRLEQFSDPERFPLVSAIVPELRVSNLDAIFAFGLDVIFDALQARTRTG
ncbi:MAG TPA: TetR/AcrR family transcriptional regulator C-terminal domain-containing protein [Gammaproteobacteria bacterium]|nr:TetR/AcrR family transcriptional regulator C-terminal domain-containing protein [Gammaproteobacteria bacterium]